MIADGETEIGGRLPVNTDGGLIGNGEPIGASGLRQIHELVRQLRGSAGPRQVPGGARRRLRPPVRRPRGVRGDHPVHLRWDPLPEDLLQFAREVREFLDAHAPRAAERAQFRWGEGDDRVAYFGADPPEVEERKLRAARDWQRTRYSSGFGWISGPPEYGGRGLTPVHELVYGGIESEYDVPDTGTLSVIGLGMIGPTILAHGLTELEVVLEEMGAALACSPFFATVVLAAQALLASADEAACARYLPGIAAGRTIATLAAAEGHASWDPAMVTARAERTADSWILSRGGVRSRRGDGAHLLLAGVPVRRGREHPGARRHRVHLGAPRPPVLPPRQVF